MAQRCRHILKIADGCGHGNSIAWTARYPHTPKVKLEPVATQTGIAASFRMTMNLGKEAIIYYVLYG